MLVLCYVIDLLLCVFIDMTRVVFFFNSLFFVQTPKVFYLSSSDNLTISFLSLPFSIFSNSSLSPLSLALFCLGQGPSLRNHENTGTCVFVTPTTPAILILPFEFPCIYSPLFPLQTIRVGGLCFLICLFHSAHSFAINENIDSSIINENNIVLCFRTRLVPIIVRVKKFEILKEKKLKGGIYLPRRVT